MNAACVVAIRLVNGDDILAILVGDAGDKVRIEHPFFVKFNPLNGSLGALPYCNLTDETYFEITKSKVDFVTLASDEITRMFLKMVTKYTQSKVYGNQEEEEQESNQIAYSSIVQGNDTKH